MTNTGGFKLLFGQGINVVVITGKYFLPDNVKLESWCDDMIYINIYLILKKRMWLY